MSLVVSAKKRRKQKALSTVLDSASGAAAVKAPAAAAALRKSSAPVDEPQDQQMAAALEAALAESGHHMHKSRKTAVEQESAAKGVAVSDDTECDSEPEGDDSSATAAAKKARKPGTYYDRDPERAKQAQRVRRARKRLEKLVETNGRSKAIELLDPRDSALLPAVLATLGWEGHGPEASDPQLVISEKSDPDLRVMKESVKIAQSAARASAALAESPPAVAAAPPPLSVRQQRKISSTDLTPDQKKRAQDMSNSLRALRGTYLTRIERSAGLMFSVVISEFDKMHVIANDYIQDVLATDEATKSLLLLLVSKLQKQKGLRDQELGVGRFIPVDVAQTSNGSSSGRSSSSGVAQASSSSLAAQSSSSSLAAQASSNSSAGRSSNSSAGRSGSSSRGRSSSSGATHSSSSSRGRSSASAMKIDTAASAESSDDDDDSY